MTANCPNSMSVASHTKEQETVTAVIFCSLAENPEVSMYFAHVILHFETPRASREPATFLICLLRPTRDIVAYDLSISYILMRANASKIDFHDARRAFAEYLKS